MTIKTTMARLRGALEVGLGVIVVDCLYRKCSAQARAWIDGYVLSIAGSVSAKSREPAAGGGFHVQWDRATWRWCEHHLLERAWPTRFSTTEFARCLLRSAVSVRVTVSRLDLGARPHARHSKCETGAETSAA